MAISIALYLCIYIYIYIYILYIQVWFCAFRDEDSNKLLHFVVRVATSSPCVY